MDEFKNIIKKRKSALGLFVLGIVVLNFILYFLDYKEFFKGERVESGVSFLIGMLLGVSFLAIFLIYEYAKALKDDQRLKKLYIDEHDERKALIKAKMAEGVLIASIVLLIIAINISVYFSPIIAITLICELFVLIFVTLSFKLYYSRKY
ncbi:MAG: hypothetical protein RR428_00670 [Coprobacillus sp.]